LYITKETVINNSYTIIPHLKLHVNSNQIFQIELVTNQVD
jgi:hypothetical protein